MDIVYSDDAIITKDNKVLETNFRSVEVELPLDLLRTRAETEDSAGLGIDYQTQHVDYLGVIIDPENFVGEADEDNNVNFNDITYAPWDINGSGRVTPTDVITVINSLGESVGSGNSLADIDGNGIIESGDALAVIDRLGYTINGEAIKLI